VFEVKGQRVRRVQEEPAARDRGDSGCRSQSGVRLACWPRWPGWCWTSSRAAIC
jgi:hypothetical protein